MGADISPRIAAVREESRRVRGARRTGPTGQGPAGYSPSPLVGEGRGGGGGWQRPCPCTPDPDPPPQGGRGQDSACGPVSYNPWWEPKSTSMRLCGVKFSAAVIWR